MPVPQPTALPRIPQFDLLRLAIILTVVAGHTFVAYSTLPGPNALAYPNSIALVRDGQGSAFLTWLYHFLDPFLMPVAFFLSGFFLPQSLAKRGPLKTITHRAKRLAPPYLLMVFVLMPLAYYVPFTLTGHTASITDYLSHIYWADNAPSGTSWFLWVLFAFDTTLITLLTIPPVKKAFLRLSRFLTTLSPAILFMALLCVAAMAWFLPTLLFDDTTVVKWAHVAGPLYFEKQTFLLHFSCFAFGALVATAPALLNHLTTAPILPLLGAMIFLESTAGIFKSTFPIRCVVSATILLLLFMRLDPKFPLAQKALRLAPQTFSIYIWHFPLVLWGCFVFLLFDLPWQIKWASIYMATICVIVSGYYVRRRAADLIHLSLFSYNAKT